MGLNGKSISSLYYEMIQGYTKDRSIVKEKEAYYETFGIAS